MNHSKTHYLGKSREVLQINDTAKLHKLLEEQRGELMRVSVGFGSKRMSPMGNGKEPVKNKKAIHNIKQNIARILTRINQLKQQDSKKK